MPMMPLRRLATINIAKLLSKKHHVWKASLMTTSRTEVNQIVESEKLFCFNEYFYGKARTSWHH